MDCKKCNDTHLHHGLPCIHCTLNKEASELRREMYGAAKWALASAGLFGLGTAAPYAKLVLSKANEVLALNPAKRAVLAQDIRRCLRVMFTVVGTPQARVINSLHVLAFNATESTSEGSSRIYVEDVRSCGANERWEYDEVKEGRKADQQAAIQDTQNASAGLPFVPRARKQSLLLYVCVAGGVGVSVAVDVIIAEQMMDGTEFELADDYYHLPPGAVSLVAPMLVGGHGPCVHCDAITASQPLQRFKAAFAQAGVKAEESNTYRIIRELKEMHQKLTGDLGI